MPRNEIAEILIHLKCISRVTRIYIYKYRKSVTFNLKGIWRALCGE